MSVSQPLDALHRRYQQQARWTQAIRRQLLEGLPSGPAGLWLEVGAGTGAVTADLSQAHGDGPLLAIDLDAVICRFGARSVPRARWLCADAHRLPLRDGLIEATFFHFVLLWLDDPHAALLEASRVTKPGGWILALAEPDHAARLDFPDRLAALGAQQTESLADQGADVTLGRRLRGLFSAAGLAQVEAGVLGGAWGRPDPAADHDLEWDTLERDLSGRIDPLELAALRAHRADAEARGEHILFVPTFYASGRVP